MPTRAHNDLLLPFDYVQAKIQVPAPRPGSVFRTALVNRLRAGRGHTAVSLVAPAGYGKTTLLAQLADRDDRAFAWVSLDERDNDPIVLMRHVAAALDGCEPLTRDVGRALRSPGDSIWTAAVPRLAGSLAAVSSRTVLVLDNALAAPREGVRRGGRDARRARPGRLDTRPVGARRCAAPRQRASHARPSARDRAGAPGAEPRRGTGAAGRDRRPPDRRAARGAVRTDRGLGSGPLPGGAGDQGERRGRRSRVHGRRPVPRRLLPFRVPRSARPRAARVPPADVAPRLDVRPALRRDARRVRLGGDARVDRGRAGLPGSPRPLPGALPLPPAAAGPAAARGRASRAGDGRRAPLPRRRVAGGPRRAGLGDSARRRRRRRRPRGADRGRLRPARDRRRPPRRGRVLAGPLRRRGARAASTGRRHRRLAACPPRPPGRRRAPAGDRRAERACDRSLRRRAAAPVHRPGARRPLPRRARADARRRSVGGGRPCRRAVTGSSSRSSSRARPWRSRAARRRGRTVCASRPRRHRSAGRTRPSSQRSPSGRFPRSAAPAPPRSSSSRRPSPATRATPPTPPRWTCSLRRCRPGCSCVGAGPRTRARHSGSRSDSARRSRRRSRGSPSSRGSSSRAHTRPCATPKARDRCSTPLRACSSVGRGSGRLRPASSSCVGSWPRSAAAGSEPDPR